MINTVLSLTSIHKNNNYMSFQNTPNSRVVIYYPDSPAFYNLNFRTSVMLDSTTVLGFLTSLSLLSYLVKPYPRDT